MQIEREAAYTQFTMIVITGIRDIHINSIHEDGGHNLARNLAHVYHFYLFGDRGRSGNMKLPSLGNSRVPVSIVSNNTCNRVNSRYCRHSRDRNLVSILASIHNSGRVREKIDNVFAGFMVEENTQTD